MNEERSLWNCVSGAGLLPVKPDGRKEAAAGSKAVLSGV